MSYPGAKYQQQNPPPPQQNYQPPPYGQQPQYYPQPPSQGGYPMPSPGYGQPPQPYGYPQNGYQQPPPMSMPLPASQPGVAPSGYLPTPPVASAGPPAGYPPANSAYPPPASSGMYPPPPQPWGHSQPQHLHYQQVQPAQAQPLPLPPNAQVINGVPRMMGRKKALLIGINYKGTSAALRGCIQDVQNVKQFLMDRYGFVESPQTMVILTDDQTDPWKIPTKQNIMMAMQWLVAGAAPGDSLFVHFSGHGGSVKDKDGDEEDGYDETILPLDFKTAGHIVDDQLHAALVRPLPAGVRLTCLFDSCHSGTALDLPYVYLPTGQLQKRQPKSKKAAKELKKTANQLLKGNVFGALSSVTKLSQTVLDPGSQKSQQQVEYEKTSAADVIMFSGCKDSQTSADTHINGQHTGAMSWGLLTTIKNNPYQTYNQILQSTRQLLMGKYSQTPQLSSGRAVDMNTVFLL